jgi:hypothetical protein
MKALVDNTPSLDGVLNMNKRKNYGNSNISPCKNIIFKKSSKRHPKSFKILL